MVITTGSIAFIGLGLYSEKGMSVQALERARAADEAFLEGYTSLLPGFSLGSLEEMIGKRVRVVGRGDVEDGSPILSAASSRDVAFFVAGDPFVATTHVDLRIRAIKRGIRVDVLNAPSIISVAPGALGLQNYKFGKSATITFPDNPSDAPYEALRLNKGSGLHTLFFLDLRAEEGRFMSAGEGIRLLLDAERRLKGGVFGEGALAAVLARAGGPQQLAVAGPAGELAKREYGPPPHCLVVPGKLHFIEAEALSLFAGADESLVRRHM